MKLRKVTRFLAVPVLLLAFGLAAWSWVLHSEPGARWLFNRLDASIPATVRVKALAGNLGSGLKLTGLQYDDGNNRVDAGRVTIAVNVDLLPPAIRLETLQADGITIRTLQDTSGEPGEKVNLEEIIPGLALPLPLHFNEISITDLKILDHSGASTLAVQSIETTGSLYKALTLERSLVSLPGNEISLSVELGFDAPHPVALEFQARGEFILRGGLEGNLESAAVELASDNPQLQLNGTLQSLLDSPSWNIRITSPRVQWPLDETEPEAGLSDLVLKTSGELAGYQLDLEGNLELQGLAPSLLTLEGKGTTGDFTARSLSLAGPELSLQASGNFSWEDALQLSLDVELQRLDPQKWLADWPAGHAVNGRLSMEWGGDELSVPDFDLAVADTSLTATGHAMIDLPSGIVDAELEWNGLSWPPGSPEPQFSSSSGSFLVSGQPEQWKLDGELAVRAGEFPEGRLRLNGTGNLESFDLNVERGEILGGTVSGIASLNWTESQPFELELSAEHIDITALAPEYPGILNTRLAASGELEPLSLSVNLHQFDSTVLGHPVRAEGGFHFEQGRAHADHLVLASGESTLSLNGSLYEPGGVGFAASVDSLDRFSEELGGQFEAQGRISLNPETPVLVASLSGRQLKFGPLEIDRIESHDRPGATGEPGREITFSGLVIDELRFESLMIRLGGGEPLQNISLKVDVEDASIGLGLRGSINDWADPWRSGWSGSLAEFRLDYQDTFFLTLDEAVNLDWSSSRIALDRACFSGSLDGRLCLESSWRSPGEVDVFAELAAIPLGLVEYAMGTDVRFSQLLSGTLTWSQTTEGPRTGSVQIDVSPGTIEFEDDDVILAETGPARFGFELVDGHVQEGNFDIDIPGSGNIDIDFSMADLSLGPDSPVQGSARIDLSDVGAIGRMVPVFDTIDGLLDVDVALSGTLSDPAFKGRAVLANGHIEDLASGFSFSEINLAGEVSEFDRSELNGSFRAGDGEGEINATIYFEDITSPVIEFALKGDSLTLVDVPDLKVVANPDLELNWRNRALEIDGSLVIPAARLSPSYLPESSIPQSDDVVIVAGELPGQETDSSREKAVPLRGNLEVSLGDNVVIDLDIAQIKVTGGSGFNWRDELIPIANGAFDLSGEIQAYGQFLRITRGRIGFPEIPANNPHLNIRAEREIFGNAQIRRAGLMVAGTLRRPLIEAYTVPMTNKHRAQTLLITGSDFNYEQGVGAVDVGMYVLPRLYVSYGIGVFEDGNVIKARFDLARGFGITATSGQRETGLDISYTLER